MVRGASNGARSIDVVEGRSRVAPRLPIDRCAVPRSLVRGVESELAEASLRGVAPGNMGNLRVHGTAYGGGGVCRIVGSRFGSGVSGWSKIDAEVSDIMATTMASVVCRTDRLCRSPTTKVLSDGRPRWDHTRNDDCCPPS